MIATLDLAGDDASGPDAGQPFLFAEMSPTPAPVVPACGLVVTQPRAFPRIKHRDEAKTSHTIDGIVRLTWTCRACGHVRGRP